MTFHVGQKVECVAYHWDTIWDAIKAFFFPPPGGDLVVGARYTVSKVHWVDDCIWSIEVWEVHAPGDDRHWFPGFQPECFRPIVERKTDISIFQRMLIDAPNELEAAE